MLVFKPIIYFFYLQNYHDECTNNGVIPNNIMKRCTSFDYAYRKTQYNKKRPAY